jgi:transcriptional regulator with XRE-family HTH domain
MTLNEWLSANNVSSADFAVAIGVSRQALWRYRFNERVPKPSVIAKIHGATAGAVTANDFMAPPLSHERAEQARQGVG